MVWQFASIRAAVVLFLLGFALLSISPGSSFAENLSYTVTLPADAVRIETPSAPLRIEVRDPSFDRLRETGLPALPYKVINILLPQGERVGTYVFRAGEEVVLGEGVDLELARAMVSEDGVEGEGMAMAERKDGEYPSGYGRYLGTAYLHGRGIASFAVFPVRVRDGAVVVGDVRVEVTTEQGYESDVVVRERYRAGFAGRVAGMLSRMVVNPEMGDRYSFDEVRVEKGKGGFQPTSYPSLEGSAVDYVIVTTDALAGEYQRLADFKTAKGVPTVVRTVEWIEANTRNGVDQQETIRFFVQDAYAKWGITYLLLGGDTDILPARFALSRFLPGRHGSHGGHVLHRARWIVERRPRRAMGRSAGGRPGSLRRSVQRPHTGIDADRCGDARR